MKSLLLKLSILLAVFSTVIPTAMAIDKAIDEKQESIYYFAASIDRATAELYDMLQGVIFQYEMPGLLSDADKASLKESFETGLKASNAAKLAFNNGKFEEIDAQIKIIYVNITAMSKILGPNVDKLLNWRAEQRKKVEQKK